MIQIKNTGNVVNVKFELFGWILSLDTSRTHELDAVVLSKTMREKMENRLEMIRREAYNVGYANGRAKVKKQSVFSCYW